MLCRVTKNSACIKVCFSAFINLSKSYQGHNLRCLSSRCHLLTSVSRGCLYYGTIRFKSSGGRKGDRSTKDISSLVQPVSVKPYNYLDGISVGEELAGAVKKGLTLLISCANSFCTAFICFPCFNDKSSKFSSAVNTQPLLTYINNQLKGRSLAAFLAIKLFSRVST
jgi:hypothetical protein